MVTEVNNYNGHIGSAADIREKVEERFNIRVKDRQICKVMRDTFDMSYRKIKPMSIHANSEKNLVLR